MSYLLDSNVISELRKPSPNEQVLAWYDKTPDRRVFTSVLVIGELKKGIEQLRRRDVVRAEKLDGWFATIIRWADERALPVTSEIAEEWARLMVPDPLPVIDGLIAATGRVHGLTVVTRNTRDFERTGVKLLNPFEAN